MTAAMTPCRALRRRSAAPKKPGRQRGQVLLLLLLALVTGAAYLLVQSLNASSIAIERDRITQQALAEAKEALIVRAVSDDNRPGSFPCPDIDNDGSADTFPSGECKDINDPGKQCLAPSCISIGRLPWRTLRLPDLRDEAGERLWYVRSHNFRDANGVIINSDTSADLSVFKASTTSNVIAIIFAVGKPLSGQIRDSANENIIASYLEGENADGDTTFVSGSPSDSFNDRLIFITHDELLPLVEKRVGKETKNAIDRFRQEYGTYPWLAPFADPTIDSNFQAVVGTRHGLVPYHSLGKSFSTDFSWSISGSPMYDTSGTVTADDMAIYLTGSATIAANSAFCTWTTHGVKGVQCSAVLTFPDTPAPGHTRTVTVALDYGDDKASFAFKPADASSLTTRQVQKEDVSLANVLKITDWDGMEKKTTGTGSIVGGFGKITTSGIRLYPELPQWYANNDWQRFIRAVVAPGFVPGGADECSAGCLAINGNEATLATGIPFVILTAGRQLDDTEYLSLLGPPNPPQMRPSANLHDYFDSSNNVAPDSLVFDREIPLSAAFNDQIFY